MKIDRLKPIVITGSHRSGTTWVGKMIDLSPAVGYIHEPFSPKSGICKYKFNHWYTYVCYENESLYEEDIRDCLNFKYQLMKEGRYIRSFSDIGRLVRDKFIFERHRLQGKRPLVKDPISLFSAKWLATRFNMEVIIMIRHPAAFAGSLKKANWEYPFSHFLQQPLLMQHHLQDYHSDILHFANSRKDIVDQAILLWNITHHMILKYLKNYKDEWLFIKHEELSHSPVKGFNTIYNKLDIPFPNRIKQKLLEFSNAGENDKDQLRRDSKSNIWSWKNRLTEDEVTRVHEQTLPIAQNFYTEEDWIR